MKDKFTIGIDFGTLSGRGVLVRTRDGEILSTAQMEYPHGILKQVPLEGGEPLPDSWCLQYPADYLCVLEFVIPKMLSESSVPKEDIIGIGIDFTSCTMLPIDENAVPLCEKPAYRDRRNAYAKLWKHHGAQKQADQINRELKRRHLQDDPRFGGKVSSELMIPKVMEILEEDPQIYEEADEILEAGDWLTRVLTGSHERSCSMAGYKAWWSEKTGYPGTDFFESLDVRLKEIVRRKMPGRICRIGGQIGLLSKEWADRLHLLPGIPLAPTVIDSLLAVGADCIQQQMLLRAKKAS